MIPLLTITCSLAGLVTMENQKMASDSIQSTIDCLRSPDDMTRLRAVQELGKLGPQSVIAVPALLQTQADINNDVSLEANRIIKQIGAPAIPILLRIIRNPRDNQCAVFADAFSDDNEYRGYAADALASLGPVALPDLLHALDDPNEEVREAIIESLPHAGAAAERAIPKLTKTLHEPHLAQPTAITLAQLAKLSPKTEEHPAFKLLVDTLKAKDVSLRRAVVPAFEFLGDKVSLAIPALTEAMKDADEQVREQVTSLLERLKKGRTGAAS